MTVFLVRRDFDCLSDYDDSDLVTWIQNVRIIDWRPHTLKSLFYINQPWGIRRQPIFSQGSYNVLHLIIFFVFYVVIGLRSDHWFALSLRDAILSKKCSFFEHCSNGGGRVNPCSKIMSEIVVCSGGHLTT